MMLPEGWEPCRRCNATGAWFYVNGGSITVVCGGSGGQAVIRRSQLKAALAAMRKPRSR
jgi:hypothetical protein